MSFSMKLVVSFKMAFPDEKPKELSEYLKGISKETLLQVSPFFLGFNSTKSEYSNIGKFLEMFFSQSNILIAQQIFKNISNDAQEHGYNIDNYEIPYSVSSLSFFEYIFDSSIETENILTNEEAEINILKAYLFINQHNTEERGLLSASSTEHLDIKYKAPAVLLTIHLNNFDLTNYNIAKVFTTQLLRAIYFFTFLEEREDTKQLITEFYQVYGVQDYHDYLKRVLPFAAGIIKRDREAHTDIVLDENAQDEDFEFIDKFIINPLAKIEDTDFTKIRSNPILKINDTTYRVISPLFVLEMIYNGLYWKLKAVNDILKEEKVKNFYNLKTYEYSEKFVLNNVLNSYFGNRYFQKSGHDLDKANYQGAPDYYVRNGKRIFIFESKDIMISAKVKQSSDFAIIEKEIRKKLYINEEGKSKAVLQLINNVQKVLTNLLEFDNKFKGKNAIVYPILVVHHRVLNSGGLNKLIN